MKVLLTGHRGYIGSVLQEMLRRAGHDVVGLDSGLFVTGTLGPPPPEIPSLDVDVRDVEAGMLRGFDAVIHLAGISNDPLGDLNPECTLEINHRASVRLAELAKKAGVGRFLYASSCSIYGASRDCGLLTEAAPFHPVTPYGASKMLSEADLTRLASASFSPSYIRAATAYGFSPRLRADLVVNNLTGYAVTEGKVLLKSDGMAARPLVHVEDICRAYTAILHAPRDTVHDQPFNVGRTSENYRVRDVAEAVAAAVPGAAVQFGDKPEADTRYYEVDCSKLEGALPEYRPRWTVRAGIEELRDAYRRHGLDSAAFLGPGFLRIKQIVKQQREGLLDANLRRTGNAARPAPRA
ncbi:MAG: SDR family oxidoreductase [Planctomycetes bacterium]|nr:SDR family oxidoreductase [Planctomycetota bacterium]